MLDQSTCLKYYSKEAIQKALLATSSKRELGVRYLQGGFGKRPDMLYNPADVLEFAKQGVSSFHISEEHWKNPLQLSPSLKRSELEELRMGWDFIIDIDCPHWELAKRIAFVIIKILKKHGITSISCKFSGNKGFHIGVPAKAFPEKVQGKPVSSMFPEGVKRIMRYIAHYAEKHHSEEILKSNDPHTIAEQLGIPQEKLFQHAGKNQMYDYLCQSCGKHIQKEKYDTFITCEVCKALVKPLQKYTPPSKTTLNFSMVLGLDEVLISSRHLYRMAYSLHEKSGLVSLPINPFRVLSFEREHANPDNISTNLLFLDDAKTTSGEATELVLSALEFNPQITPLVSKKSFQSAVTAEVPITQKVPVELFPPAILKMLEGVKDGKKRALFVLVNFLNSVGWNYDEIDELLHVWNSKNQDPLRETVIKSQLTYHKTQRKKALPPNYAQTMYYGDIIAIDAEEMKYKNPVAYVKKRLRHQPLSRKQQDKKKPKKNSAKDNPQSSDAKSEVKA